MKLTATRISAISRIFTPGVFHQLAKLGRSPLFASLFSESGLFGEKNIGAQTVASGFEYAFSVLSGVGLRNEYIYRAALTRNILLGQHSLDEASMLSEFRIGACKADVVVLNGVGTVYEIKSDRDSLSRLNNQVTNYQKVFSKVFVIAGNAHVQSVLDIVPEVVGVLQLSRSGGIDSIRNARLSIDDLDSVVMFEAMRVDEAKAVLRGLGVALPSLPNTVLRGVMQKEFGRLDPFAVNEQMVKILKKSRNQALLKSLVSRLPPSLQPAAVSFRVKQTDHDRLLQAVNTPLDIAMGW